MLSRRHLLPFFAILALAAPAIAAPDEDLLGRKQGYPIGNPRNWFFEERVRVGSFSHLDSILPHYTLQRSASPLPLSKAASEPTFQYRFDQKT
jgi:hypothetical protein